jgi:hypothetical protein
MTKHLMPLFLVVVLASCAYSGEKSNTEAATLIACEEPRPQICTREYNPVCASLKDGTTQTAATGCTACSDSKVVGYEMGECKK